MIRKFLTISILCLSLTGLASTISAQNDPCDLKLEVKETGTDIKIDGATGKAVNSETSETVKAIADKGVLFFAGLKKHAKYTLTVKKSGYKRTVYDQVINCSSPVYPELTGTITMQKGSSKDTFVPTDVRVIGAFKIGELDSKIPDIDPATPSPPPPPPPKVPKIVSRGVINGVALVLARPKYPQAAKAAGASGPVSVQVTIDEEGNVTSAAALSGHPLLRDAAVDAAKASRFKPTLLEGHPVKVSGIIVYNFN